MLKERPKISCAVKTPIYIKSSDEEGENESQKEKTCIRNDLEEEWGQRQNDIVYVYDTDLEEELSESEDSMAIEQVPLGYYKELTPREVYQVRELETFYVPPKVEKVQGRTVYHKGILFYKAENVDPSGNPLSSDDWEKWLKEEEEEYENIEVRGYYNQGLISLFQRTRCLDPMSKQRAKIFHDLWNGKSRRVIGLDGKIKNTKGLGFQKPQGETLVVECHTIEMGFKEPGISEIDGGTKLEEGEIPSRVMNMDDLSLLEALKRRFQAARQYQEEARREATLLFVDNAALRHELDIKKREEGAFR